jgi:hypothetical protein
MLRTPTKKQVTPSLHEENMMNTTRVADLSIAEFQSLIRETIIETVRGLLEHKVIPEIEDAEQRELEAMFGNAPEPEEFVTTRSLEL